MTHWAASPVLPSCHRLACETPGQLWLARWACERMHSSAMHCASCINPADHKPALTTTAAPHSVVQGVIAAGSDADVIVLDPKARHVITAADHHSAMDTNIYEGKEILGKVGGVGGPIHAEGRGEGEEGGVGLQGQVVRGCFCLGRVVVAEQDSRGRPGWTAEALAGFASGCMRALPAKRPG